MRFCGHEHFSFAVKILAHIGFFGLWLFGTWLLVGFRFEEPIDHVQKIFVLQNVDDIDNSLGDLWDF